MAEFERLQQVLINNARNRSLEAAADDLVTIFPDKEKLIREAAQLLRQQAAKLRTLREPRSFSSVTGEPWYVGPSANDLNWPAFRDALAEKKWSHEEIQAIDNASTKILAHMQPPGIGKIDTRGLVLGHVQSGKTSTYTALIAKAADVGYRFFIVLTGTIEALRRQTQERLDADLVARVSQEWFSVTSTQLDFRPPGNINAFLSDRLTHWTIAVVKKNGTILKHLLSWLGGAREEILRNCPVLVVDDEADLASINTARGNSRTVINRQILDTLQRLPKAAYVGFTATPFANVLIDPLDRDLYPKDFIVDLPKPEYYFGAERIFGRDRLRPEDPDDVSDGIDVVRTIPDTEVQHLRPSDRDARHTFGPTVAPSLRSACLYFWIATAARRARGQVTEHSTMLIHTTMYASVHAAFRPPIESLRNELRARLEKNDSGTVAELRQIWEDEQQRVSALSMRETPVTFDQLFQHLPAVISQTEVKIENSLPTADRIDYSAPGRVYIVIGGNVLSRGLTLEGLVVSFFVRTASAYDTLLQMGRWFGYRLGYSDLPRVWMTDELKGNFYDLATVEREMRIDIERYEREQLTPADFGVRIRTHPSLNITSPMKMRNAVEAQMSYSGERPQTIYFRYRDRDWLNNNLSAVRRLIASALSATSPERTPGRLLFRDIGVSEIVRFISDYRFHQLNYNLRPDLLRGYIEEQRRLRPPQLELWNVVIVSQRRDEVGMIDVGFGEIPLLNRSKLAGGRSDAETADLKAIMSTADIVADLHNREPGSLSAAELIALRTKELPGRGLLLVYPIAKDSKPQGPRSGVREPLGAAAHVLGVSFVFPESPQQTPQKYMTARIPADQFIEELEEQEAEQVL